MINVQISGILHKVFEATVSRNGFEKRLFWLKESDGRNMWQLEAHQGMSNELLRFTPGQAVSCQVEIQGREWVQEGKERVTNTLRCWKIEAADFEMDRQVKRAAANVKAITE